MLYTTSVTVTFPQLSERVYEGLIDLDRHPLWNSGMVSLSRSGKMTVGLHYETKSVVLGRTTVAAVEVTQLLENRVVKLRSDTGEIPFSAHFELKPKASGGTTVTCTLEFELAGLALTLARPAIESMAKSRVRGDLEMLRAILSSDESTD
jgi:carbon monoxide dehydrogenase subunit G